MTTAAQYAEAGFGVRYALGKRPAVIVVDLANAFTHDTYPMGADLTDVVAQTRRVLDVARQCDDPVFYTTIAFNPTLEDAGIWLEKCPSAAALVRGSEAVEIDERLGRRDHEPVLCKRGASAFFGTHLITMLLAQSVDTVVLCGASTSGCIRATAVDLLQFGIRAVVPEEAVGDRAELAHTTSLDEIQGKYANVETVEWTLSYLERCGHWTGALAQA